MTPLPDLLRAAAGDEPVGFDVDDVRRRVAGRERRQRTVLAAAVVLVVLVVALAAVALVGPDDDGPVVDQPSRGPVTADELEAGVWLPRSFSTVAAVDASTSLAFVDGRVLLSASCPFEGRWELRDGRLRTSEVRSVALECEPSRATSLISGVLAASPTVGRIGGGAGSLELRSGADAVGFRRADRIGRVPTADEVIGTWEVGTAPVTFTADGTVEMACGTDAIEGSWALDGGEITIRLAESSGSGGNGDCFRLALGDGDPFDGTSAVRIEGEVLYLATDRLAITLER